MHDLGLKSQRERETDRQRRKVDGICLYASERHSHLPDVKLWRRDITPEDEFRGDSHNVNLVSCSAQMSSHLPDITHTYTLMSHAHIYAEQSSTIYQADLLPTLMRNS
jgi:hypothetical protein